jgi:hypothetical protein
MRWLSLLALVVAAPAFAQEPAPPPEPPPAAPVPTWYAQALTSSMIGPTMTFYWSKGRSMRAFTVVQGRPVLTLVHAEWYYVIDQLAGTGLAVQRSARAIADDAKGQRPFAWEADVILSQGAERVRTEDLGGMKAHVYRLTDRVSKREVWIPESGERVPLLVEVFDRGLKQTRRIQYAGWRRDLEIPDDYFRPDPRVVLERLSYDEYLARAGEGPVGELPVLYGSMLHGTR